MQQLTINLIPLEVNNAIVQCSFLQKSSKVHIHYTKVNYLANYGTIISGKACYKTGSGSLSGFRISDEHSAACQSLNLERSSYYYHPKRKDDTHVIDCLNLSNVRGDLQN